MTSPESRRTHGPSHVGRRTFDPRSAAQILGLFALSAAGAELLQAYDDSTGSIAGVAFALVFFGALYGVPALLIREAARRLGWGWPSILLLALAFAILQPGVIDQALFSDDYRDIEGWDENQLPTMIAPLGFSAFNAFNFIGGHLIYSFCAPIAVAEAWRPSRALQPWLGLPGLTIAAVVYVGTAALIITDPESQSASGAQLAGCGVAVMLCIVAAIWVGRRQSRTPSPNTAPGLVVTLAGTLVFAVGVNMVPETWAGVAIAVALVATIGATVAVLSRRSGWDVRHGAAAALGFLLGRGLVAFTYFPLVGEVSPARKYSHNVVMILLVCAAGWVALRGARHDEPQAPDTQPRVGGP